MKRGLYKSKYKIPFASRTPEYQYWNKRCRERNLTYPELIEKYGDKTIKNRGDKYLIPYPHGSRTYNAWCYLCKKHDLPCPELIKTIKPQKVRVRKLRRVMQGYEIPFREGTPDYQKWYDRCKSYEMKYPDAVIEWEMTHPDNTETPVPAPA